MKRAYGDLIKFVNTRQFKLFHKQLMSKSPKDRPGFVANALFNPRERRSRGILLSRGILIQTSAFGDRRPTLFAVKKLLPRKYHPVWENVNLTFDNEYKDKKVLRTSSVAWRPPLPVALQNSVIAAGENLEAVPKRQGVNFGMYAR